MRVVIHAGMHKTGSSAIQDHFWAHSPPEIGYLPWTESNHCGLFILLFEDEAKLAEYHGFRARGPEFTAKLPALRQKWTSEISDFLDRNRDKTILLSAEDISANCFHDAVEAMRAFFARWTDDLQVIAYARSPRSFAVSQFQQMLRAGLRRLDMAMLWPHYRKRFEPLEQVFGRENVQIRAYDRASLVGGDIVRDFASAIGASVAAQPTRGVNTTLSAEATALLFAQRKLGDGFVAGFASAQIDNAAFISGLRKIGHSRFDFSDSLWQPVLQHYAADLDWIEQRLGQPLTDRPARDVLMIGSEDDLLKLAQNSFSLVEQALAECVAPREQGSLSDTVRALDQLRKLSV